MHIAHRPIKIQWCKHFSTRHCLRLHVYQACLFYSRSFVAASVESFNYSFVWFMHSLAKSPHMYSVCLLIAVAEQKTERIKRTLADVHLHSDFAITLNTSNKSHSFNSHLVLSSRIFCRPCFFLLPLFFNWISFSCNLILCFYVILISVIVFVFGQHMCN